MEYVIEARDGSHTIEFVFKDGRVQGGRDGVSIQDLLDIAMRSGGHCGSGLIGFEFSNLEFPPTLTTLGAVLHDQYKVEGKLPTPPIDNGGDEYNILGLIT